jgi:hypothetical protein
VNKPKPADTPKAPEVMTFRFNGAATVSLVSKSGQRYRAGEILAPGSYQVWARFPGTAEVHAGQVIAVTGKSIDLRCVDVLLQCRAR